MLNQSVIDESKTDLEHKVDVSDFHITGWNILVRPVKVSNKTKGGIILAEQTRDDVQYLNNVCEVLKLGPLAYKTSDLFKETGPWCKEGDYVIIPKNAGQKLLYKQTPVTLIKCDSVLGVIDDPTVTDPTYNITNYS